MYLCTTYQVPWKCGSIFAKFTLSIKGLPGYHMKQFSFDVYL